MLIVFVMISIKYMHLTQGGDPEIFYRGGGGGGVQSTTIVYFF